jgi:hypothetical protein
MGDSEGIISPNVLTTRIHNKPILEIDSTSLGGNTN